MKRMNVLIDRDDSEAVAITNETDLTKAVRSYIRTTCEMSEEYFNDGQESLTAEQFLERPDLIRDAFKLEELPVILSTEK